MHILSGQGFIDKSSFAVHQQSREKFVCPLNESEDLY